MELIPPGKYGLNWPENWTDLQAELALYSNDKLRGSAPNALPKHEHFENAIKSAIPAKYLVWHRWLHRAIESWCYEPIASEWGASSMGKSSDFGLIALFDTLAAPADTLTVLITNPLEMHWERAFKYAHYYHSLLPKAFQWLVLKKQNPLSLLYDYERIEKVTGSPQEARRTGIICFSNKAGDSFDDLKRRIGAHERRMRLFVDEPQGCSSAVLKLKINMGAGAGIDYRERFLGNPSSRSDPLGQHSEPSDADWKKTEYLDEWETVRTHKGKPGKCYVRDGINSPAHEDPDTFFFLFGPDDLADAEANYGKNSQEYWTFARGRLLGEGGQNTCITEPDLEALDSYRKVIWESGWTDYAGFDAAAEAHDANILIRVRCGREMNGRTVAAVIEKQEIRIDVTKPDNSGQIAKQVLSILNKWNIPLDRLAGDVTGNQGPIFDRIESDSGTTRPVYRVNASGFCSSPAPIFEGAHRLRRDRYYNRATELFFNIVTACQHKQLILLQQGTKEIDVPIVHQLTTRRKEDGENLRGKIRIEQKKLYKKRNAGKSPNDLDALLQVMALLVEKNILTLNEGSSAASKKRRERERGTGRRMSYTERRNQRRHVIRRFNGRR